MRDKNFCPFIGKESTCSEDCALWNVNIDGEGGCSFFWISSNAIKELEKEDE